MRYYVIAGEKSGDLYGGRLIQTLKAIDPKAVVRGLGGKHMAAAGAELMASYGDMAVMGLRFLARLRKLYRFLQLCKQDLSRFTPDAVILIDYGGFNLRIAAFAKKKNCKVFYYVPPKVWAWRANRIRLLAAHVDHVFAILPFEKEFYARHGYDRVTYVGHPLVDEVKPHQRPDTGMTNYLMVDRPIIALLPGSRVQEVERILPYMVQLAQSLPAYQLIVAGVSELPSELYKSATDIPGIIVVYDQTYDVLSRAHIAIVTAGTATLEAALFNVPQVVVYKTDRWTYYLARYLLRIRYISLVNILANRQVVPELIQGQLSVSSLLTVVKQLLNLDQEREAQWLGYEQIRSQLGNGDVAQGVAADIVSYLR